MDEELCLDDDFPALLAVSCVYERIALVFGISIVPALSYSLG